MTRILGNEFDGTIISDCFTAYQKFAKFFQKCWAHLLRTTYYLAEENKKQDITKLHRWLDNLFNEMSDFLKTKPPPEIRIKKTMCHPHLKVWVCDRHLFLGCSKIEDK